jgi:phosphoglucosamine mutase
MAVTVMSTGALESLLPEVEIVRTPVGDRFVRDAMERGRMPLGGEDSGHVLFGDHPGGDGILTGLRALVAGFAAAGDLARAYAPFVPLPRVVRSVVVARRPPLASVPSLASAEREAKLRLGPHGRTLLRYSGTEPVIRILVEGEDAATVGAVGEALAAAAQRELA